MLIKGISARTGETIYANTKYILYCVPWLEAKDKICGASRLVKETYLGQGYIAHMTDEENIILDITEEELLRLAHDHD